MKIPSLKDISPKFGTAYEGNDEKYARLHFGGKNLDEAEAIIRENALYYGEEIFWMGSAGFCYYIFAFIRYIESEHSRRDSDAINALEGVIRMRLECAPKDLVPIAAKLGEACRYVLANYEKFEADSDIYGDLRSQYEFLIKNLTKLHV